MKSKVKSEKVTMSSLQNRVIMKALISKTSKICVVTGLGISILGGGLVLANNITTKEKAMNLINQLQDITLETSANLGSQSAKTAIYQNAVTNLYTALGMEVPSDTELEKITPSDIEVMLNNYVSNSDGGNVDTDSQIYQSIKSQVESDIMQSVNGQLGSEYVDIDEVITALQDIKISGNTSESARITYLNQLQAIYGFVINGDGNSPSADELLEMRYDQVANDILTWHETKVNDGVSSGLEQYRQNIIDEVGNSIGIEGDNISITDIQNYIETLKTNAEQSGVSSGEADMQDVVNKLEQTIEDLGEEPNENYGAGTLDNNVRPPIVID